MGLKPYRFSIHFYRATLCVSAVFAVARCLSVRPSVTFVHCIHMAEDIVKILSRPGSTSLEFSPNAGTQFQGEPLQQRRKTHGVGKFCDFRLKSPFISETVRDRPMVAIES